MRSETHPAVSCPPSALSEARPPQVPSLVMAMHDKLFSVRSRGHVSSPSTQTERERDRREQLLATSLGGARHAPHNTVARHVREIASEHGAAGHRLELRL